MKHKRTSLGTFLQQSRERKSLSLRDVESTAKISNAYLSQLENGKIAQPSPVVLHQLCELYEVPYTAVLELAGYPVPESSKDVFEDMSYASRIGPITKEEEQSLLEYLEFIRSKRIQRKRR